MQTLIEAIFVTY